MKRLLAVALGLCASTTVHAQPLSAPPDAAAGAELFRARGCVECHAADVSRFQAHPRPLFALAAAMWSHFPLMAERIRASKAGRPYLTSAELRDLVVFLYAREPTRSAVADASVLGRAGDPKHGEQLVATKGCLACHSISASHGRRAGSLAELKGWDSPWNIVAQMWNHAFLMQLEAREQGAAWAPLSETEMSDLVAYLQQLMRQR